MPFRPQNRIRAPFFWALSRSRSTSHPDLVGRGMELGTASPAHPEPPEARAEPKSWFAPGPTVHATLLYCTLLYSTLLYSTLLYSTLRTLILLQYIVFYSTFARQITASSGEVTLKVLVALGSIYQTVALIQDLELA